MKTKSKFYVVFKRRYEKDILAGDAYIIEATTERLARKEARELLKARFFNFDIPKIAWVDNLSEENIEKQAS